MSDFTKRGSEIWRDYETDGVPSSGKRKPVKGDIRTWATQMENLLSEAPTRTGFQYTYSSNLDTTQDPGAGFFRMNAALDGNITEIAISDLDRLGLDWAAEIATWDDSGSSLNRAKIIIRGSAAEFGVALRVVGANVDGDGFTRLAVSKTSFAGEAVNNLNASLVVLPTGETGGTTYVVSGWFPGDALPAGGEKLIKHRAATAVVFPTNFTGSSIESVTAAPEDAVYTLKRYDDINDLVGTVIGTATIATGQKTATFVAAEAAFAEGNYIAVHAPDPSVAGLTDLNIELVAAIQG